VNKYFKNIQIFLLGAVNFSRYFSSFYAILLHFFEYMPVYPAHADLMYKY